MLARISAWMILALSLSGCATPGVLPTHDQAALSRPRRAADPEYRVATGDEVEIHRAGAAPAKLMVGPDGCLRLGADAIRVDNLTPGQIAAELAERQPGSFPDCRVTVAKFNSQFVYLAGDDKNDSPRAVPYQGKESLGDFLARVGCRKCRRGYRVRLVRGKEEMGARPEVVAVRFDADLRPQSSEAAQMALLPNDHIYLERDHPGPGRVVPKDRLWPWTKRAVRERTD